MSDNKKGLENGQVPSQLEGGKREQVLRSFGKLMFHPAAGLLVQGELVFHYGDVENLILQGGGRRRQTRS